MKKVVVLGAGVHALGVIRSFGIVKGYRIEVFYSNVNDFAYVSKYVFRSLFVKDLDKNSKKCIDFLVYQAEKKGLKGAMLVATNDEFLKILSVYHDVLSKHYVLFTPPYNVTSNFLEKKKTYKLCEKLGVPHPKTYYPKCVKNLDLCCGKITFPVIVKPVLSHKMVRIFNKKLFVVNSFKELKEKFELCFKHKIEVMITEYIPGNDSCMYTYSLIYSKDGRFIVDFMHNTIRQTPPNYGVSRVAKSIDVDSLVANYSKKILEEVGFYGFAGIQYKKDPRDGVYKLIEVNCRTIRPIILQTYSGLNALDILYRSFVLNEKEFDLKPYRKGVYYIELYSELVNYLFRKSEENFTWKDYKRPYKSKWKVYGVYDKNDMKPFYKMIFNLPGKYYRLWKGKF